MEWPGSHEAGELERRLVLYVQYNQMFSKESGSSQSKAKIGFHDLQQSDNFSNPIKEDIDDESDENC